MRKLRHRNLATNVKQLVNDRLRFKPRLPDFGAAPPNQFAMSLSISQLSGMHAWQPRHPNLWQDLSTLLGLRLIIRIRQHKRNWVLLVPRDTALALWPQSVLSVLPHAMGIKDILLHPDSPCLSKPLAGGPATANPLHTVADPSQLLFYPIDADVVITSNTPCHRFRAPGTRVGPVRWIPLAYFLKQSFLFHWSWGSMIGPLFQFPLEYPWHSVSLKSVSLSATEVLHLHPLTLVPNS